MAKAKKYLVEVVEAKSFLYEVEAVNKWSAKVIGVRAHHDGMPKIAESEIVVSAKHVMIKRSLL